MEERIFQLGPADEVLRHLLVEQRVSDFEKDSLVEFIPTLGEVSVEEMPELLLLLILLGDG